MKYSTKALEQLVSLAMAGEQEDPIDWSKLKVTEGEAYRMMARHVLEMDPDPLIQRSVIVKLLVENFVLNLKLLGTV